MKIFNNNFRNILLSLCFFLFAATLSARQSEQIPGVLHIKFSKQTLPATKNSISLHDISDLETYSILERNGFKEARKIFSNFQPQDTLGISRNGTEVRLKDLSRWYRIEVDSKADVLKLIDTLRNTPGVESVSPALAFYPSDTYPNDSYFKSPYYYQWGLYNYYTLGKDIHAVQAWDINKGRNDVKIAVVDGGIDYNHTDLDPGNRTRVIQGIDTGEDDNDPMDDIPEGPNMWGNHGTPVAGVIGAITNNNSGVAGIMWNCSIIPIKVANNTGWGPFGWGAGSAFDWDIADGIDYARSNGASVINMSFGGEGNGFWENLIIGNPIGEATWNAYQQGVVLVGSMGNDDNNTVNYPAGYPWVIAVGATNRNDQRVTDVGWGSNYGSHIDVSAPGISEYSTRRSQNYSYFGGTSCAAPMVSGVAGLIISQARDRGISFTNDDVKHLLEVSAFKVSEMQGAEWTQYHGYGRINAGKALELLSAPYTVTTQTIYNSSGQLVWDSHQHQFYNNGGLATGNYYGVKQYKVAGHVTFPTSYISVPYVWIRERECKGWSYANPNKELTWVNISNITTTGFDYETVIYLIKYNLLGEEINKYWPGNSSSLQARIVYTVIGQSSVINVPQDYSTISAALNAAISGQIINVSNTQNLSGNLDVPSGITLNIQSDATVNLNSYAITTTNGTITIESGATINSSNSHTRLITGSAIKGIYSTIPSAMSAATSGQSIEVYGSHTLAANLTVPPGVTLTFKNGSDMTLDSHTIQKGSGSLAIESGATFTPDIRLKSGSTVLGLYTSLDAAYADGSDVEIRGTHTFTDYYTVNPGRTLRAESGSKLRFPSGKYLNVYGTLHGNQADYTSTSGTWGGIRYRSGGSGTLNHCTMNHATYGIHSTSTSSSLHFTNNTISGCSYGIYCSSSSPEIRDNTISTCSSYGIYLYNSSPELESNRISGSKVYLNNSDASLENNLITGAYGNEAVYFYASSPSLYSNTITSEYSFLAIYATNGSDPVFGGSARGGYNYLSTGINADGVIWATNSSNPVLGWNVAGECETGPYIGGNNSIIGYMVPAAAIDGTSSISAQYCWWGQTPAPPCVGNVNTNCPLSSDPGTGSTLSKSSPEPVIASHPEEKPDDEAAKALWEVAMSAVWEKNYTGALDDFQTLIRLYPASTYAYRALSMSVRLCREQKTRDMITYLDELLTGVEDKTLRAVIKSRKVSEFRRMKDTEQAIALSREILAENPETIHETTALFDLFNLYQKDLADSVQAEYYVTELKTKYPEDDLTGIARIDWGENPEKVVIRKQTLPEKEKDILPETFTLGSAYPNPFNSMTTIQFFLPEEIDVILNIYDINGRLITQLINQHMPAGYHTITWDATPFSSGIYFAQLQTRGDVKVRKLMLMK